MDFVTVVAHVSKSLGYFTASHSAIWCNNTTP